MVSKTSFKKVAIVLILLSAVGCATYQSKVAGTRNLIKNGQITQALEQLKPLAETEGIDQLVYLLEYGIALQIAGQIEDSTKVFLMADKLADIQDYHSVSKIAAATLGSEEMIQYKGENYEKTMINAYLAINYLILGKYDDAMVEVRRLNEKINLIRQRARENFELNPFSQYLAGLIYESDRKYDDAYIAFEKAYKIGGMNEFLPQDLIRASQKARRTDSLNKWKGEFQQAEIVPASMESGSGEVILIYQQGWGPEKNFAPHDHRMPALYPVHSRTSAARMQVDGKNTFDSRIVYNLEQAAMQTLSQDYAWMAARKLGAFIAKEVVADQIRQKDELAGFIALVAMRIADRADLRQWSTLPRTIQMARAWLKPGKYKIAVQGLDASGAPIENLPEQEVIVRPGKKTFLNWRSLN